MSSNRVVLFLSILLFSVSTFSQSIKDVRINEIQVHNVNGFRDEYGQTNGWIELHNKGYGKVNIAGCTLKVKGKAYQIPRGDPATVIPTRGYAVFFADGTSNKGTFYTNFTLDDTDYIELYDVDGNIIDSFQFNLAGIAENASYGWFEGRDGKETLMQLPATTPGSSNNTIEKLSRAEAFKQADPSGILLTVINIVIVAIALTLLFFVFTAMGNFHIKVALKKDAITSIKQTTNSRKKKRSITNDELAVIAMALYKYSKSVHDNEELTLTINSVSKVYSPWSSKIYGLRRIPNKK